MSKSSKLVLIGTYINLCIMGGTFSGYEIGRAKFLGQPPHSFIKHIGYYVILSPITVPIYMYNMCKKSKSHD